MRLSGSRRTDHPAPTAPVAQRHTASGHWLDRSRAARQAHSGTSAPHLIAARDARPKRVPIRWIDPRFTRSTSAKDVLVKLGAVRATRSGSDQHELSGAPKPDHADGHAAVHSTDQVFSKRVREPRCSGRAALHVGELRPPHKSLANLPRASATAAGVADRIWTCEEIAALLD